MGPLCRAAFSRLVRQPLAGIFAELVALSVGGFGGPCFRASLPEWEMFR